MRSIKKLMILLMIIAIVSSLLLSFAACNVQLDNCSDIVGDCGTSNVVATDDDGNDMLQGAIYEVPTGMVFNWVPDPESAEFPSVQLTAIITPATATYKEVDWTIGWEDGSSEFATGKAVTDYVTVESEQDGGLVATVTCLAPFEGNIIITVATRVRDLFSSCTVKFEGKPDALNFNFGVLNLQDDGENGFNYHLKENQMYYINIHGSGFFDVVGERFCDYEAKIDFVGSFEYEHLRFDGTRVADGTFAGLRTITNNELFVNYGEAGASNERRCPSVDVVDGLPKLIIDNGFSIENMPLVRINQQGVDCFSFIQYTTPQHHFVVTVTEKISGATGSFQFVIDSEIVDLSIDSPEIIF